MPFGLKILHNIDYLNLQETLITVFVGKILGEGICVCI